jgi:hypothetical protein
MSIWLVVGVPILLALGYATVLTRSKAEDAKLRMLDSFIRSATDDSEESSVPARCGKAASRVRA